MNTKDGSGPAFPHPNPNFHQDWGFRQPFGGMSLRDWFASHADLSGLEFQNLNAAADALNIDPPANDSIPEMIAFSARIAAAARYLFADAMLAERAKP